MVIVARGQGEPEILRKALENIHTQLLYIPTAAKILTVEYIWNKVLGHISKIHLKKW